MEHKGASILKGEGEEWSVREHKGDPTVQWGGGEHWIKYKFSCFSINGVWKATELMQIFSFVWKSSNSVSVILQKFSGLDGGTDILGKFAKQLGSNLVISY